MAGQVICDFTGAIATIRLCNPARRNALTVGMLAQLERAVTEAEARREVRVIAITGTDGHFCAGGDLTRFEEIENAPKGGDAIGVIAAATKPTVALIEGACIGGGALIALACDLRLASTTARFGLPPSRLGVVFPLATVRRVVNVVGAAAARDLLLSARNIDAQEALRMGLANEVCAPDAFAETTAARLAAIAQNSPRSVQRMKAMIDMILAGHLEDTDETRAWAEQSMHGADVREGQAAFLERRPPRFED